MQSLVNKVTISAEEKQFFSENGFIKIKQLLTKEAVNKLRKLTSNSNQMKTPPKFYSGELSKIGYDVQEEVTHNIYSSANFKSVLKQLTSDELVFMQAIAFEVESNQKGFPWHHDIYSFCYTMPEDLGYTLWIPLIPINTKEQHGGMAYVSRQVHSSSEYFNLVYELVQNDNFPENCQPEDLKYLNFQYASKLESLVLDNSKVEDDFELGDAMLLDKVIWHKSCPLKEGKIPSRMAYVMRLIGSQARYSKAFLEGTYFLLEATGNDVQSDFGYKLSKILKDGVIISQNLVNSIVK